MAFTHLHLHTEYSLLDGLLKVPDLIDRLKDFGMNSCAITDHGTMYGYFNFWTECGYNDIKPIIGSEVYVARRSRFDKDPRLDKSGYHLVLLAKNETGFHNLIKLTSLAQKEGFYYKPRIDRELLEKYSEGLIALSGCMGGEVPVALRNGNYDEAKKTVEYYKSLFDEDSYYIEIQRNGLQEQDELNPELIKLAKETGTPIVATGDVHYLDKEDWKIQEVVWAIADGKKMDDENRRKSYGEEFYLKSPKEMEKLFKDLPEAIENTQKIADMIEKYSIQYDRIQPKFWNRTEDEDAEQMLRDITYKGAKKKYGEITKDLEERIEYELKIIHDKGYDDYFLVVGDIMQWARREGMTVGARGSAGGSVVAYCNDIINIEPIGWECYFERFLNPERPSPPDIDMDIQDDRREEMLDYVREKYGEDNFAAICAIGRMKTKAAIRDVARVMDVDLQIADKLSKMVHVKFGKVKHIEDMMKDDPEFAEIINGDPQLIELKKVVSKVEDIARHMSTHACGYLVTPNPIIDFTPVQRESGGGDKMLTQIEGYPLEETGLMKFDFLGLRNLTIITNILKTIEENTGKVIKSEEIPLDDAETFKNIFAEGKTTGVFQFESDGMKKYLRELQPTNIEDLCFMAAAYRPGPMQFIPGYIDCKFGRQQPDYLIPELEEITKNTYGYAIYQEQVIKIAVDIAGFSMGRADLLRRAMGKKKIKVMKQEEPDFKAGVMKLGYDQEIADKLWEYMLPFADYGFNKAHSAAYAVIAYWTGYLKAHYPREFIAGVLRSDIDDTTRIVVDMQEAEAMGLQVLPPNINQSFEYFSIEGENGVRFGLAGIKNVGHEPIKEIIRVRGDKPFKHLDDLLNRVDLKNVNKKSLECLIKVGAMDEFGDRNALLELMPKLVDSYLKRQNEKSAGQSGLFDMPVGDDGEKPTPNRTQLPQVEQTSNPQMLEWEKDLMGLYLTTHPLKEVYGYFKKRSLTTIDKLQPSEFRKKEKFGCIITAAKKILTKNGDPMMFVTLEDQTGTIEGVIFPTTYEEIGELVEIDIPVIIKGSVSERNDSINVIIDYIQKVDTEKAKKYENYEEEEEEEEEEVPEGVKDGSVTYTSTTHPKSDIPEKIELHIPKTTSKTELTKLRETLVNNPGDIPVVLFVQNGAPEPKKMKLGKGVEYVNAIKFLEKKYRK